MDVMRIINEPTAAAIAYGLDQKDRGNVKERTVRSSHLFCEKRCCCLVSVKGRTERAAVCTPPSKRYSL